ncbi:MAG: alkaline phosphatase family protein [Fimbriimonas sp.]|nr:alkaline phosphatase family protein [Fimbriimonas sp.]
MLRGRITFVFGAVALILTAIAIGVRRQGEESSRLVTGKYIAPAGDAIEVGSFPVNMKLSPDGRFIVVTDCGFREQLSVIDASTGRLLSKKEFVGTRRAQSGLYYGLAFGAKEGKTLLYVSRGAQDLISTYVVSPDGVLTESGSIADAAPKGPGRMPHNVAGLVVDGSALYAVNNQTHAFNGMHGSVSQLDGDGKTLNEYPVGGYPIDIALAKSAGVSGKLYVSNERDGDISEIDLSSKSVSTVKTGANPVSLLLNRSQSRLFVGNSCSDTVSVLDTATDRIVQTIFLRIGDLGGLTGATPLGMALSRDEKTLYVALSDLNAVGVVSVDSGKLNGFIPAGWGPTSVVVSPDSQRLFVANAKGVQVRNPNDKPVRNWGQYHPNILEGAVTVVDLPSATKSLESSTKIVIANNMAVGGVERKNRKQFVNPGIDHVVYIIKENRTYDQILGDDKHGNGAPSICLFPEKVTPNQHALADRFVLLDNFYVCAEVSYDGWTWSTQGIANPYVERNVVYNYSGRGRSYDTEGENSGVPVDLRGVADVARAPGGYIWDQCARQHVSYRNYGFFLSSANKQKDPASGEPIADENAPAKKALQGHTDLDFLQFDTAYADSDAWVKYKLAAAPRQMETYGSHHDPSRISTWRREFDEYVKNKNLPRFCMVRLMRDHTAGTSPGQSSPSAMVADNDYAVGEVVDAISHSPYWKHTVICVLEDDAQAGFDHVDCHRSTAYVISPWIERGTLDSHFYNTDSMLRTIELVLGLKPLSQYDAVASPIDVFSKTAKNDEPFDAILPAKKVIDDVNEETAYRAKDSAKLIARTVEESLPDIELNDILWGAIKGAATPRPQLKGTIWKAFDKD